MTIAATVGFMVAAMFVSLEALEIPYYVCMLGAGNMAVYSRWRQQNHPVSDGGDWSDSGLIQDADDQGSLPTELNNEPFIENEVLPASIESSAPRRNEDWRDRVASAPVYNRHEEERCIMN